MSERIGEIQNTLISSRKYLNAVLEQVDGRWESQVYSDGLGWTVRQLVHHLADADKGHNNQVMNIADGRDIIPEDFDIERYNASVTRKTAEKTVEESREGLAQSREKLMTWLGILDESKLDIQGRHASLRILTVEQILGVLADHERGHAQDIASALDIEV